MSASAISDTYGGFKIDPSYCTHTDIAVFEYVSMMMKELFAAYKQKYESILVIWFFFI